MKKNCVVCGKKFDVKRKDTKACSKECKAEYHRRTEARRYSPKPQKYSCIVCGNSFKAARQSVTCGSKKCQSERRKTTSRAWRQLHLDEAKASQKQWDKEHPGRRHELHERWRKANLPIANEATKRWMRNNPEKARELVRNQTERKRAARRRADLRVLLRKIQGEQS
jgi:hypothetical protein